MDISPSYGKRLLQKSPASYEKSYHLSRPLHLHTMEREGVENDRNPVLVSRFPLE
jgi:hypothetical protein